MRMIIGFLFFGLLGAPLSAQQSPQCLHTYAVDDLDLKRLKQSKPDLTKSTTTKFINTVVHVIYNNDQVDIDDATIRKIIEDFNVVLSAKEIDESYIHPAHRDKISHSRIQFCLATVDPNGENTNGITHKKTDVFFSTGHLAFNDSTTVEIHKMDETGGTSSWDASQYFNIWIAPMGDQDINFNYGVPVASYFPLGTFFEMTTGHLIPGAVIDLDNLDYENDEDYAALLGLLAHECGHALGMMHTFGATQFGTSDFCDYDDMMDDTPNSDFTGRPCVNEVNTCIDGNDDLPDMHSNFMSLSPCKTLFSPDQINYISQNLESTPDLYKSSCAELTSIEESEAAVSEMDFEIFPNPNDGSFSIKFENSMNSNLKIEILNASGQLLRFEKSISQDQTFHLNSLDSGIYFMKLISNESIMTRKFFIK